jgi:anti-sigma B factor antagonist
MPKEVEFSIATRAGRDGTIIVAVAGELDLYRAPTLAEALDAASGTAVVVDLQDVTFLDSTALGVLIKQHRRLREKGAELIVLAGERTPTTPFEVTGVDQLLTLRTIEARTPRPAKG